MYCTILCIHTFQSTPSAWRETFCLFVFFCAFFRFQSTPSAWRETVSAERRNGEKSYFNPLPPHGGRRVMAECFECLYISIHSLRMEGDDMRVLVFPPDCTFQSTPSAWRETPLYILLFIHLSDFNPLPPHGGRRILEIRRIAQRIFQSTPSAWRETIRGTTPFSQIAHFNPLPPHGGRHP